MNAVTFDTHAFVKRLTAAGMPEPQAEVLAQEQSRLIDTELATKRDLREMEIRLEHRITATILKWMFTALLGQTAIIAALVKLL